MDLFDSEAMGLWNKARRQIMALPVPVRGCVLILLVAIEC